MVEHSHSPSLHSSNRRAQKESCCFLAWPLQSAQNLSPWKSIHRRHLLPCTWNPQWVGNQHPQQSRNLHPKCTNKGTRISRALFYMCPGLSFACTHQLAPFLPILRLGPNSMQGSLKSAHLVCEVSRNIQQNILQHSFKENILCNLYMTVPKTHDSVQLPKTINLQSPPPLPPSKTLIQKNWPYMHTWKAAA